MYNDCCPLAIVSQVSWGCIIHQLLPCNRVQLPNGSLWYNTKLSDGETPIMQELWEMQNTPSMPGLPSSLLLEVVAPDRFLSMG